MSNSANDSLIDEARDYLNSGDISSTPLEGAIKRALENDDMEALWQYIQAARDLLREE